MSPERDPGEPHRCAYRHLFAGHRALPIGLGRAPLRWPRYQDHGAAYPALRASVAHDPWCGARRASSSGSSALHREGARATGSGARARSRRALEDPSRRETGAPTEESSRPSSCGPSSSSPGRFTPRARQISVGHRPWSRVVVALGARFLRAASFGPRRRSLHSKAGAAAENDTRGKRGALELVPATPGFLRVVARPWAEVIVDGQRIDVTPFARSLLCRRHPLRDLEAPQSSRRATGDSVATGETVLLDVTMGVKGVYDPRRGGRPPASSNPKRSTRAPPTAARRRAETHGPPKTPRTPRGGGHRKNPWRLGTWRLFSSRPPPRVPALSFYPLQQPKEADHAQRQAPRRPGARPRKSVLFQPGRLRAGRARPRGTSRWAPRRVRRARVLGRGDARRALRSPAGSTSRCGLRGAGWARPADFLVRGSLEFAERLDRWVLEREHVACRCVSVSPCLQTRSRSAEPARRQARRRSSSPDPGPAPGRRGARPGRDVARRRRPREPNRPLARAR